LKIAHAVSGVVVLLIITFLFVPHGVWGYSSSLIINEVQAGITGDANVEFIELYNVSYSPVDVAGWSIVYRSANGTSDIRIYEFENGSIFGQKDYFLLVRSGKTVGIPPNGTFSQALAYSGGGLAIRNASGEIVDSLGWGSVNNGFVEGGAASAMLADRSIERIWYQDSDNNGNDFSLNQTPSPQRSSSTVPLPAAVWLLAPSLAGLLGVRRLSTPRSEGSGTVLSRYRNK